MPDPVRSTKCAVLVPLSRVSKMPSSPVSNLPLTDLGGAARRRRLQLPTVWHPASAWGPAAASGRLGIALPGGLHPFLAFGLLALTRLGLSLCDRSVLDVLSVSVMTQPR